MKQYQGWLIWLIATLFVVYTFTLGTAASIFSDAIQKSLHLTKEQASFSFSLFIIGFACMQLPAGYLLDRYKTRSVLSIAILIMAAGNWLASIAHTVLIFDMANFLEGVGGAFDFVSASILIAQWFPSRMFPILTGLVQTLACFSVAVLHYILRINLESEDWHLTYYHFFLFGLILFVLSIFLVRTPTTFKLNFHFTFRQALGMVFHNKQNWLCALGAAASFGLLLSYASYWYAIVESHYHVPLPDKAMIGACVFVGIGVGTPLLGWISNLVRSRKLVIHFSLCLGVMSLILSLYLPHFNIPTFLIAKATAFLIGFFLSGGLLYYTVVSEMSDNDTRGLALSLTNTATFLFNMTLLMTPYLFITEISKDYYTYLWVYPVCAISSLIFNYFLKDTTPSV